MCSDDIESVVERESMNDVRGGLLCTPCKWTVIWVHNKLKQTKTKDLVLEYVDKVMKFELHFSSYDSERFDIENKMLLYAALR